jgi:hypothetical protein
MGDPEHRRPGKHGNTRNARRMLKDALVVEVVPYYRQSLEALLYSLETLG